MRVQGNVWGLQELSQEAHAMVQRAEREAMSGMLLTGEPSPPPSAPHSAASSGSTLKLKEQTPQQAVSAMAHNVTSAKSGDELETGGTLSWPAPSVPSFHAYIHVHAAGHDIRCGSR